MNHLYKLQNGLLIQALNNQILDDGTSILNFNLVADQYGYKELISNQQPSYDDRYQVLRVVYTETETNIIEDWQVVESMSLEEFKQNKINELEQEYQQALKSNFDSIGYTFGYDDEAQKNFTKVTALFGLKPDKTDTQWNTKSHGIVLLTKEQYLQVVDDAENHEWFNIGKLWNYHHRVDVAQSYDEVNVIIWE